MRDELRCEITPRVANAIARVGPFSRAQPGPFWRALTGKGPFPVVDFYGGLKGRLLGPRMSFWELHGAHTTTAQLFEHGRVSVGSDPELTAAYETFSKVLLQRLGCLDATDWEWLVADYFIAQGAHVDERRVGGSQAAIDLEARFDHGELGEEHWRVQVKHRADLVDWPMIRAAYDQAAEGCDRFAFVSTRGFTDEAHEEADAQGVTLLEAADFTRFLLSGKLRPRLREKLRLPFGDDL